VSTMSESPLRLEQMVEADNQQVVDIVKPKPKPSRDDVPDAQILELEDADDENVQKLDKTSDERSSICDSGTDQIHTEESAQPGIPPPEPEPTDWSRIPFPPWPPVEPSRADTPEKKKWIVRNTSTTFEHPPRKTKEFAVRTKEEKEAIVDEDELLNRFSRLRIGGHRPLTALPDAFTKLGLDIWMDIFDFVSSKARSAPLVCIAG
jgi:rhodanese-related sulfurtransferase